MIAMALPSPRRTSAGSRVVTKEKAVPANMILDPKVSDCRNQVPMFRNTTHTMKMM